jgi:hypothetical protein
VDSDLSSGGEGGEEEEEGEEDEEGGEEQAPPPPPPPPRKGNPDSDDLYEVLGIDRDASMKEVARRARPPATLPRGASAPVQGTRASVACVPSCVRETERRKRNTLNDNEPEEREWQ